MSAVVGLVRLDGRPVEAAEIYRMVDSMPHRCVDGRGAWAEGGVGLGHGMLHTTPESLYEALPVLSEDGRYTLTAHARVDNRQELLPLLGLDTAAPDSAVLLAAYQAWGESSLNRLVGDFAFCVWDSLERKLVVARDHIGCYPLYYYHEEGRLFAFASEPKALFQVEGVDRRLNERRVGDYLGWVRDEREATIYEGVLRLPPAHVLTLSQGEGLRVEQYYDLRSMSKALGERSDEEVIREFRQLFFEAVRCRMRSYGPLASQLSGGMDSSSVTAVARLLADGDELLRTYSILFPQSDSCNESDYIDAVLAEGGLRPSYIDGDAVTPLGNIEEVYEGLDDHLVGGTQHLVWAVMKQAAEEGVRVMLDGLDGDNVVGHGDLYFRELALQGDWAEFARQARQTVARFQGADHGQTFERTLGSLSGLVGKFAFPEVERLANEGGVVAFAKAMFGLGRHLGVRRRWLLRRYATSLVRGVLRGGETQAYTLQSSELPAFIRPEFVERVGLAARKEEVERSMGYRFESVRELQRQVLASPRMAVGFETTHHYAALHGIDIRHPFMDRRLIEFCVSLPSRFSYREGWTRYILRCALEDVLPEKIAWRVGKADLSLSSEAGLFGPDRAVVESVLQAPGELGRYVDTDMLKEIYAQGEAAPEHTQTLFTQVIALGVWLRKWSASVDSSPSVAV